MSSSKPWSPYQLAIFRDVAEGTGHTIVLARAGSGKTTTIVEALKHVPAGKGTLFVAFNKAIADELKRRVPAGVEVSTLHSYGLRQVTRACGRLRIEKDRVDGFVRTLVGDKREDGQLRSDLCKAVSLAKGTLAKTTEDVDLLCDERGFESAENGNREKFVSQVLALLERCRDLSDGRIDFDDMIWLPVVLDARCWQFDRVFVDETQDLNACQIELVLRAVRPGGRVCAVGDDRQAIYGFRGADSAAIERVRTALSAKVLPLSVTYRCCRSVVRLAKTIVPDLEWSPESPEGEVVEGVTMAQLRKDAAPGDFVLSRSNAPLIGLCLGFLREGRRAAIQGRDVGATLLSFARKHERRSVEEFRSAVDAWEAREVRRLVEKKPPRDTQAVEDKAECLRALSEDAQSVAEVIAKIEALFSDADDASRIVLSTTHKAKGLERERVFVLADTYRRRPDREEDNLYYVAVTRAKEKLFLVRNSKGEG